jgi:hypothetical protein
MARTSASFPHLIARSCLICGALALAGCGGGLGQSRANPLNWFGSSTNERLTESGEVNPLIPRRNIRQRAPSEYAGQAVAQITALRLDRRPGGAVIHAVGTASELGYFAARLVPENDGEAVKGVLSYELQAVRPPRSIGVGSASARRIDVALSLTDQDMANVKTITVKGAQNQRSVRRR